MSILCSIQSSVNPSTRKLLLTGIIGIVNRDLILIIKTRFRGVRFLLLTILNSISTTQSLKFLFQLPKRNLDKVLIIRTSDINLLLDTRIVTNYQFTNLISQTMVDYDSRFVQRQIKKILAQTPQNSQGVKFLLAKSSKLVLLSGAHLLAMFSLFLQYIAKTSKCKAVLKGRGFYPNFR